MKSWTRYLPPDLPPEQVAACIGLVSDTHMPKRCAALPASLPRVLAGVDLILHAGDVGKLRALDALSEIAPVVAVHGNDEPREAKRELPYQQVIAVAGQRILLTHAHYPDRAEELAARVADTWEPILARRAAMGQSAGASVVVFGHLHVPLTVQRDGLLLVCPGAVASPNERTLQVVKTAALLFLRRDGAPAVTHVDLGAPDARYEPEIDWSAGFRAALARFSASII